MKPSSEAEWPPATSVPALDAHEIHVWRAWVGDWSPRLGELRSLLCAAELERAARFRFEHDGIRFIVSRGVTRTILAEYRGVGSQRIAFTENEFGKPALTPDLPGPAVQFNVTNSRDLVLVAVTGGQAVGVDAEYIKPDLDWRELAPTIYSHAELNELYAMPSEEQRSGFFQCWTLKEAYVKARGQGLSIPLQDFTVKIAGGAEDTFELKEPVSKMTWTCRRLHPGEGYAGATTAEGSGWTVRQFTLSAGLPPA